LAGADPKVTSVNALMLLPLYLPKRQLAAALHNNVAFQHERAGNVQQSAVTDMQRRPCQQLHVRSTVGTARFQEPRLEHPAVQLFKNHHPRLLARQRLIRLQACQFNRLLACRRTGVRLGKGGYV
jgi:hypothetical protein